MKATIKFDREGNVKKIKGDIGITRMNRAAWEVRQGNVQPTFGMKLRRFFRRAKADFDDKLQIVAFHIIGSPAAAGVEE